MINYSFEDLLFKQIKLSQPRFSSSCKLGNSAQFSIKTPIELNTFCFVLMIIHCTSRSCHVIYTNTSVCAQRMGELEFKKTPLSQELFKGKIWSRKFISVERTFRQEFENNCRFVRFGTEPREMQLKQTNSTSPSTEALFLVRSIS